MNGIIIHKDDLEQASNVFNKLLGVVSDNLPWDWEFRIAVVNGEASVALEDPHGDDVDFQHDDCNLGETMLKAVEHAIDHDSDYPR